MPGAVNLSYRTGALNKGLEWGGAMKPVLYSVGPGSIPGDNRDLDKCSVRCLRSKINSQIQTRDPEITKQALNHCDMLTCLF